MRIVARELMGYFPLAWAEARRIRARLVFPSAECCSVLDPCAGCGTAIAAVTENSPAIRFGIELDAWRAEEARRRLDEVIHGSAFDVHCPVESFGLLWLNPPFTHEFSEGRNTRMEGLFLDHTFRWLKTGGVLAMTLPCERLTACIDVLAVHFRDKTVYRLTEPESVRYNQALVMGVRRSAKERYQLRDGQISQAKRKLWGLARNPDALPPLTDDPDRRYVVLPSARAKLVYRGIPLDAVEDLLARSGAYRQAARILLAPETGVAGRPLTPLHSGHVALAAVAGQLNGIFGQGKDRHVSCWTAEKRTDRFEEIADDGTLTIRERERFTHSLSLVFTDGRTAVLGDGDTKHEERSPANGHAAVREGHDEHDH